VISQPVGIGGFVIDQATNPSVALVQFEQGFDAVHLSHVRFDRKGRDRNAVGVGHHHDLCPFAFLGLANLKPPFFAGENVPSPIA